MRAKIAAKSGRSCETEISAMGHRIALRWWNIRGDVSDEDLTEEGERRAREMVGQDYTAGELNHEGGDTAAHGWWEIIS